MINCINRIKILLKLIVFINNISFRRHLKRINNKFFEFLILKVEVENFDLSEFSQYFNLVSPRFVKSEIRKISV